MSDILEIMTPMGRRLAYALTRGTAPVVVFLSGYKSDMEGTKALHLEAWARSRGRAFLRFDYSGHGQSGGAFEDGCIGDWAEDALSVISIVTEGPVVLVGSSMGGWIAALVSRELADRVVGFVGIAAAPDFTEDGFWAGFDAEERAEILAGRTVSLPSDHGDPYEITPRLIEDGRKHLVLRAPLPMSWPVRLLQGTQDTAVTRDTALRLLDQIDGPDVRLTLVRGADHRFSDETCLRLIEIAVTEVGG